jgi:hypothetical protein
VKIFISAILALSLLGMADAVNAAGSPAMHPRSFDYFDENGVEHTGINLNLGDLSRHDLREREDHSGDARHHRSGEHHQTVLLVLVNPDSD